MDNNLNNNEEEYLTISMTLEDGTELDCEIVAKFEAGGQEYVALYPDKLIDGMEEDDVWFYRFKELNGDDVEITPLETEEEYEIVADAFDEYLDYMEYLDMVGEDDLAQED